MCHVWEIRRYKQGFGGEISGTESTWKHPGIARMLILEPVLRKYDEWVCELDFPKDRDKW